MLTPIPMRTENGKFTKKPEASAAATKNFNTSIRALAINSRRGTVKGLNPKIFMKAVYSLYDLKSIFIYQKL
jgi:hypothetical protein